MYIKYSSVPLKGSASMAINNLSVFNMSKEKTNAYAVVGKGCVHITYIDQVSNDLNFKQLVPKIPKEPNESAMSTILEAQFLKVTDRSILVVLSNKGVFFYENDAEHLIYYYNLNGKDQSSEESRQPRSHNYAKGITAMPPNIVAIGTSIGVILLFEVPNKGTNITLRNELNDKYIQSAITALASDLDGNYVFASDTSGNIVAFNIKTFNNVKTYRLLKHEDKVSCNCMTVWNNYLFCGMETGVITMFEFRQGVKVIDICAHARWITSLDVRDDKLVSSGEDCFFRVWELTEINGKLKIICSHSERVIDCMLCAAHFNAKTDEICVTSFEEAEIVVFRPT